MHDHYNTQLKEFSRELRSETVSRAEKYIWKVCLSRKQLGVAFKRQRPIAYFIVDFFCKELKLIIEIDGNSHFTKESYDRNRQDQLEKLGYTIVRFSEGDVLNNYEDVYNQLVHVIYCLKQEIRN